LFSKEPGVIPLQALGVIDVGATYVSDNEVLANAMLNATAEDVSKGYGVRQGSSFVNEYARVNNIGQRVDGGPEDAHHTMGCYPWLWPYAMGGIETDRPINVPYNIHVQTLLQLPDRKFRLDPSFIFQAFGVLQKRQVCSSACLQVSKKNISQTSRGI
jgi:hypothetical protein